MASIVFEKVRFAEKINLKFCGQGFSALCGQLVLLETKGFAMDILALKGKEGNVHFVLYYSLVEKGTIITKPIKVLSIQNLKALAKVFNKEVKLKTLLENV